MNKTPPQEALQTLLAQSGQAGIYRLPQRGQAALDNAAKALGFARFNVDLEESGQMGAILTALGRDLDFPDWYGANFDALNDCLTDFSWREAPGYVITLTGADALHAIPDSFNALNEVFSSAIEQWQAQHIPLWVLYQLSADGLATLPTLA
jgi:RNAse (barnase) inhibitor barstar